jgi:uncharacterized membrane protein
MDIDRHDPRQGERRLPMAIAVLAAGGLFLVMPEEFRLNEAGRVGYWLLLAAFLVILVVGDPGRIDRDSRWLRFTTGLMILTITLGAAVSVVRLVVGILQKASFTSPGELLAIGAVSWITSVIAFAFWYWHLDRGGPAVRARGVARVRPSFRFPEDQLGDVVGPRWFPQFLDYFALSFNTATAFSPTDVSAIRHWSKLTLILESAISLTLIGLVVARAVNVL